MAEYINLNRANIQTILGLLDEIEPEKRSPQEDELFVKASTIAALQRKAKDSPKPTLEADEETGRLTIRLGDEVSKPTSYKEITMLRNFFAVTDAWEGIFPTNVLLKFIHANPEDRRRDRA